MSTSSQRASIELALSVLESFPNKTLTPHLARLECLARNARQTSKSNSAPIYDAVLSNDFLLGKILEFDGSLAFYHKYYNFIVGHESPLPHDWSSSTRTREAFRYTRGTRSNVLVSKKWKSMVMGQDGWDQWKIQAKRRVESHIEIALNAVDDVSLTWTARICAMAISNDAIGLSAAFQNMSDTSCGVGAALEEQRVKDDDTLDDTESYFYHINNDFQPVPGGHPFYWLCRWNMVEDINDDDAQLFSFTTSIAYAAALVGSIEVLQMLNSLDNCPLWKRCFDDKGTGILGSLVLSACANPTADCLVKSISSLLSRQSAGGYNSDNLLHIRHRGCNGNHLHLAAGRGHTELVRALIQGGMNPKRRCERITPKVRSDTYGEYSDYDTDESSDEGYCDPRDKGVKDFPLPEDWAEIRGHTELMNELNSDGDFSRGMTDGVKRGYAKRFNTERGFGFIKPEDGGKDVFVHISNIENSLPLEENEYVEYTTEITGKGIGAVGVNRLNSRW